MLDRKTVRDLVHFHARELYKAECAGRFHARKADEADEIAALMGEMPETDGLLFRALYAEEVLALERDMRATPDRTAFFLFGDLHSKPAPVTMIAGPAKPSPAVPVLILIFIAGLAIALI